MPVGEERVNAVRAPVTPFRRMLEVQAAHAAGDALVAVSLAGTLFFSVSSSQARDRVGLYLLITMTPFALISPVVGPLLDRWRGSYRIAIIVAAAGRAILALYAASRTERLVLYPLAFGLLALSRAHGVSRGALVPEILPAKRSLVWANSRLSLISVLAASGAGAIGASLHRFFGAGTTLWFAAAVFSGEAILASRLPSQRGARRRDIPHDHRALLTPRLLAAGIATSASRAALGFIVFVVAFALRSRNEGVRGFAAVLAVAGIGSFAGSVLAPILGRALRGMSLLLLSLAGTGTAAFAVAPGFGLRSALIVSGVCAAAAAAARLAFDGLIQQDAPEEIRARTFARYETLFQLAWVGGAGAATAIHFSGTTGLRVAAGICAAGIVLSLRGALKRARKGSPHG